MKIISILIIDIYVTNQTQLRQKKGVQYIITTDSQNNEMKINPYLTIQ